MEKRRPAEHPFIQEYVETSVANTEWTGKAGAASFQSLLQVGSRLSGRYVSPGAVQERMVSLLSLGNFLRGIPVRWAGCRLEIPSPHRPEDILNLVEIGE